MKIGEREYSFRSSSVILSSAAKARIKPNPLWQIILFPLIYFGSMMAAAILAGIFIGLFGGGVDAVLEVFSEESGLLGSLFMTIFPILGAILYIKVLEGRSMASMGFIKCGWWRHYLCGFGVGLAMCSVALLLALILGGMGVSEVATRPNMTLWLLTLAGFMVQGMSEEVMLRGYLTVSLASRMPVWLSVAITSLLFAFMHGGNTGLTPLSLVNLVLFGIFAAVFMLRYDNIWGIGALHSAWNFCQGNIFGVAVSGSNAGDTLLSFSVLEGAPRWISGGEFGLEGSIVTTVVFGGMTLWMLLKDKNKAERSFAS
ncbi:MAG: CPBP family intramembrane metalloprotease [Tidjanibacter sp.]|nr:CPBP family intramembrane metalloprotease [Tidjanibacter sp.]